MGTSGNRGPAVDVQKCLEGFHRRCIGYVSRQFVPKWDSPNTESILATVGTTSLLMEPIGVCAQPCAGRMGEDGLDGKFQKTTGNLQQGY